MKQPAFPTTLYNGDTDKPYTQIEGLTMRDYFAAKALEALIIKDRFTIGMGEPSKSEQASDQAYDYADAMIKARGAK